MTRHLGRVHVAATVLAEVNGLDESRASELGLQVVEPALAWWNDEWSFRKEIAFDLTPTGSAIPGSETEVPVLIRLVPRCGRWLSGQAV